MYVTNQPRATIKSWYTGEYSSSLSAHFRSTARSRCSRRSLGRLQQSAEPMTGFTSRRLNVAGHHGSRTFEGDVASPGADVTLHGGTIAVNGSFAANTVRAEINRLDFNKPQTTMNAFRMISSYSGTASFNMPSITLTELDIGGGHAVAGEADITLGPGGISNWGGYDTVLMGDPSSRTDSSWTPGDLRPRQLQIRSWPHRREPRLDRLERSVAMAGVRGERCRCSDRQCRCLPSHAGGVVRHDPPHGNGRRAERPRTFRVACSCSGRLPMCCRSMSLS